MTTETLYKLTTAECRSRDGDRLELCEAGLLHVYRSSHLALLRDPGDASYGPTARLWECQDEVVHEIPLPAWYGCEALRRRVRVRFALLCWQALRRADPWGVTLACEGEAAAEAAWAAAREAWAAAKEAWAAEAAWAAAREAWAVAAVAGIPIDFCALAAQAVEMESA